MPATDQLPESLEEMLRTASLEELTTLFETLPLDAREHDEERSVLSFPECPDALITWLVSRGLDVDTRDRYDATPLWQRAHLSRAEQIPLLVSLGADVQAATPDGLTPLHAAARGTTSDAVRDLLAHGADPHAEAETPGETPLLHGLELAESDAEDLTVMVEISELLLAAGAEITEGVRAEVRRLGDDVEEDRDGYEPEELQQVETAMHRLYEIFEVPPSAPLVRHDGVSPIVMPAGTPGEQRNALIRVLVPARGRAATAQGEALVLAGSLWFEADDDSADFWDRDQRLQAKALRRHLASGTALDRASLKEAATALRRMRRGVAWHDEGERLNDLTLAWVRQNPTPLPASDAPYEN